MPVPLNDFRPGRDAEPTIRVGVVLTSDDRSTVEFEPAGAAYHLVPIDGGAPSPAASAGRISIELSGTGLAATVNAEPIGAARGWRLEPVSADEDRSAARAWVHRVVAGRGFHWEKEISVVQPGAFEITRRNNRVLVVGELGVEDYLAGVITSEMGRECPAEFLKAQCVVARSWTMAHTEHKHDDLGFDYCNDDCCQRFHGVEMISPPARDAVQSTAGEVLLADGEVIVDANYSKSCGGVVEDALAVFGVPKRGLSVLVDAPAESPLRTMAPVDDSRIGEFLGGAWLEQCDAYCSPQVVPNAELKRFLGPVDTGEGFFRWKVAYAREELEHLLRIKMFDRLSVPPEEALTELVDLRVTRRGYSGRAVAIELTYVDPAGLYRTRTLEDQYWIRHALAPSFLYSSAVMIETARRPDGRLDWVTLRGAGWGHGVGFCQIGGLGMALKGFTYDAILRHYFPEAKLHKVY